MSTFILRSFLILFLSVSIGLTACMDCIKGEGDIIEQEIDLATFHSFNLKTSADVFITQGNVQQVKVSGYANLIKQLNKTINGETWEIDIEECIKNPLKIYITLPDFKNISISGSGDIISKGNLNVSQLDLKISGSGNMDLTINAQQVNSTINGAGDLTLKGSSLNHFVKINGSGDISAYDFTTTNSEIDIIGAGDAEVFATGDLTVDILGAGDVSYKGNTTNVKSNIKGAGEVKKR